MPRSDQAPSSRGPATTPGPGAEIAWLTRNGVTLVLDVGANAGQTGSALRQGGYHGRIVSFEPIREIFDKLAARADTDPLWTAQNLAIGTHPGPAEIGVSANLVSSSLRAASDRLVAIHAPVGYVRHETVSVARLDALWSRIVQADDAVHLKIDTRGFEREVIAGAAGVIDRIGSVRIEVAVSEVYDGEMELPEAITMMRDLGFVLIEAWPAWRHPASDEVLHFDLMFRRCRAAPDGF